MKDPVQNVSRTAPSQAVRLVALTLLAVLLGAGATFAQVNAYVATQGNGSISVLDTSTNTVTATIPGLGFPRALTLSPDSHFVYATTSNGMAKIDTATNTITGTVMTGNIPIGIAVTSDGATAYVANNASATISVVDTATMTVTMTLSIFSSAIAITPDRTSVWVGSNILSPPFPGVIFVIDTATNTFTNFPIGHGSSSPNSIAFTPDGAFAYLPFFSTFVSVFDTATQTEVATVPSGPLSNFAAVSPDGAFTYVTNFQGNSVSVIDTTTNSVVATVPVGVHPREVAFTPDGAFAYVTNNDGSTLSVIDTVTQTVVSTLPIARPWGIVIGRLPNVAPVLASDNASVTVNEGQTAANTGTVTDANHDTVTLTASVGTVVNNGNGTWSWSFATTDGPAQSQTVTITGDDGHGGVSSTSFSLVVNNVAPTITSVSNNGPVITGNPATVTVTATDPAGANDPLAYQFDCDNNGVFEIGPQAGNSASCTFASAGSHTVNVRVTDGDGGAATGSTVVTVLVPPPNCSGAVASSSQIWPPNHKLVPIQISGVTNPGGGALTISVTSVFQDEPTDSLGDGNTCPDGTGLGTATANLRAERSALGNGRVYTVSFTATGAGGSCQGSVTVCVPHSDNGSCGNGGALFNSGVCNASAQAPSKALIRDSHKYHKGLLCGSHLPTPNCDLFCDASLILCH